MRLVCIVMCVRGYFCLGGYKKEEDVQMGDTELLPDVAWREKQETKSCPWILGMFDANVWPAWGGWRCGDQEASIEQVSLSWPGSAQRAAKEAGDRDGWEELGCSGMQCGAEGVVRAGLALAVAVSLPIPSHLVCLGLELRTKQQSSNVAGCSGRTALPHGT